MCELFGRINRNNFIFRFQDELSALQGARVILPIIVNRRLERLDGVLGLTFGNRGESVTLTALLFPFRFMMFFLDKHDAFGVLSVVDSKVYTFLKVD